MVIPITPEGDLNILRGDMIEGGMKMPALLRYLPHLNHTHFAYVGSVYGSGAWAVAEACARLNYQCTLFVAKSDYTPPWLPMATGTGANIIWCDPMPVKTIHQRVSAEYSSIHNLPLGFDCPEFIDAMADVIRDTILPSPHGGGLGRGDSIHPSEIWLPALSGVVARAACNAFPDAKIHAVSAAKHHGNIGRAILHTAPEKYHKPALTPPPHPACPFSDAKVWQFVQKTAVSGAYILNVSS